MESCCVFTSSQVVTFLGLDTDMWGYIFPLSSLVSLVLSITPKITNLPRRTLCSLRHTTYSKKKVEHSELTEVTTVELQTLEKGYYNIG